MTRISSTKLWIHKVAFPILWFGFLTIFLAGGFAGGLSARQPLFLVVPAFMAAFGYFLMKKLVWDLADEVYDCGDSLLVRKSDEEERIPLSNIINVSSSLQMNPPRVTLRLARPGKFGDEVAFSPDRPFSFNLFARIPAIEDLIVRVDRARAGRASSGTAH